MLEGTWSGLDELAAAVTSHSASVYCGMINDNAPLIRGADVIHSRVLEDESRQRKYYNAGHEMRIWCKAADLESRRRNARNVMRPSTANMASV